MRKLKLLALGALFLTLALAATTSAFATPPAVGPELFPNPFPTCTAALTYPPNTAFHTAHGWAIAWPKGSTGAQKAAFNSPGTNFTLLVDGNHVAYNTYHEFDHVNGVMDKLYLYNFPSGMTGTHTFTLDWYNVTSTPILQLTCQTTVTFT